MADDLKTAPVLQNKFLKINDYADVNKIHKHKYLYKLLIRFYDSSRKENILNFEV
jgi:hypothetical protein